MFSSWLFVYLIILFLFDISPSISFVITVKNTVENKSLKTGLFTALGVATSAGISATIGFLLCSILDKQHFVFQSVQMLGMSYLLCIGIKMLTVKKKYLFLEKTPSTSKLIFDAYKSGFLYTFSNLYITTIIISIISQFYGYISNYYIYFCLFACIPVVSFFSSMIIVCCCYFFKLWQFFNKYAYLITKLTGFMIVILTTTNVRIILK